MVLFGRPGDLPPTYDYHLFREGILPAWEDPANANGGKWILRFKKGLASRMWEDTLLAVIGDHFGLGMSPVVCVLNEPC